MAKIRFSQTAKFVIKERVKNMIELKDISQLERAINRAKAGKLFVQATTLLRQYKVTNRETGSEYYVNFFVRKSDRARFAQCECKAGQNNLACKHIAAAAGYHLMRMIALRESSKISQMPIAA